MKQIISQEDAVSQGEIISQDKAFKELAPLNGLLYESLDAVALATKEHFIVSKHSFQPHFFAAHIRTRLREVLEPEANQYNFAVVDFGSNSFYLAYKFFLIRIYKAQEGELPVPGDKKTRLEFYNKNGNRQGLSSQNPLPGFGTLHRIFFDSTVNLVAYYDVDVNHEFAFLKIACPRFATPTYVDCFWNETVQSPLENHRIFVPKQSAQEREDVIFTLRDDTDDTAELVE